MPISTTTTTITIKSHAFLTRDIFKTGVLTGIILLTQLVLYFLLKNHVLTLPIVKYWKGVKYYMASMYCVKCRAKRDDPSAVAVTMKNGKPAMKGKCPVCGTEM